MSYFLITCDEDGIDIRQLDKDALLQGIQPDNNGCAFYGRHMKFIDHIPSIDKGQFTGVGDDNAAIVIRGEIIVPKPIKVATRYEV